MTCGTCPRRLRSVRRHRGEAAKRVPEIMRAPDERWRDLTVTRDRLAHAYDAREDRDHVGRGARERTGQDDVAGPIKVVQIQGCLRSRTLTP